MACANFISETKLDNRVVRCEMDGGFKEGRQFGRGLSGGQVRDDRRSKDEYDPGRGGYGRSDAADGHHFRRSAAPRKRSREGSMSVDEPARKYPSERRSPDPTEQKVRRAKLVVCCHDTAVADVVYDDVGTCRRRTHASATATRTRTTRRSTHRSTRRRSATTTINRAATWRLRFI